jgi:hypothetical protein
MAASFEELHYGRRRMIYRTILCSCLLVTASGVGCGYNRPLATRPGSLEQQRFTASVHDPYADNDAGPEVVGARPREFSKPRAEPTRSRAFGTAAGNGSWWSNWFGGQ